MTPLLRRLGLVGLLTGAALAGGCAVYATPGDVGVAVIPPPVVVAPAPVLVRPYSYYGYYGYRPAPRIYPRYPGPGYGGRGYGGPPRGGPYGPPPRYFAPR